MYQGKWQMYYGISKIIKTDLDQYFEKFPSLKYGNSRYNKCLYFAKILSKIFVNFLAF